eukprot:414090_1
MASVITVHTKSLTTNERFLFAPQFDASNVPRQLESALSADEYKIIVCPINKYLRNAQCKTNWCLFPVLWPVHIFSMCMLWFLCFGNSYETAYNQIRDHLDKMNIHFQHKRLSFILCNDHTQVDGWSDEKYQSRYPILKVQIAR